MNNVTSQGYKSTHWTDNNLKNDGLPDRMGGLPWWVLLCSVVLLLTGCTAQVGESCGGFLDGNCITNNCIGGVCAPSDLGGKCDQDFDCRQGYCILDTCRNQSQIGGLCESNNHCVQGVCKEYLCALGTKGDVCENNDDCDSNKFECYEGSCVSKEWYCGIARFFNVGSLGFFAGLVMVALAIGGTIFGITLPGINIEFKIATIVVSLLVLGIALGALGIGIFATCY